MYNFDKEEILASLMDGDSIDDIAGAFTKAINAAKADYDAEMEKLKSEEAAETAKEKKEAVRTYLEAIQNLTQFYPSISVKGEITDKIVDKFIDILDETDAAISFFDKTLDDFTDSKNSAKSIYNNVDKKRISTKTKDIIDSFLNMF